MKFKLLKGHYTDDRKDNAGKRTYNVGQVVETDIDLAKAHPGKFAAVSDVAAETETIPIRRGHSIKKTPAPLV